MEFIKEEIKKIKESFKEGSEPSLSQDDKARIFLVKQIIENYYNTINGRLKEIQVLLNTEDALNDISLSAGPWLNSDEYYTPLAKGMDAMLKQIQSLLDK